MKPLLSGAALKRHVWLLFVMLPYLFFVVPKGAHITTQLLIQGKNITGEYSDGLIEHFPDRVYSARIFRHGALPLWNDTIESGVPHAATVVPAVFYPFNIVFYAVLPPALAFNLSLLVHFSLAGLCMHYFLRSATQDFHASLIGAVVFMFCGFLVAMKGNIPLFNSAIWIPVEFLAFEKWLQTADKRYPLVGGLALCMQVLAGWAQMALFSSMYLFVYALCGIRSQRKGRIYPGLIIVLITGVLLSLVQIVPTLEFRRYTNLDSISYSHFIQNSFAPAFLPLILFPNLLGAGSLGLYRVADWSPPTLPTHTIYVGILPLLLAGVGLWRRRWPRTMLFGFVTGVVSLILSFGGYSPLSRLLFHVPAVNFFRDHFVHLIFLEFSLAILSAWGVLALNARARGSAMFRGCVVAGLLLAVAGMVPCVTRQLLASLRPEISPLPKDWAEHLRQTLHLSNPAIFIPCASIAAAVTVFLAWYRTGKSNAMAAIGTFLIMVDLFMFGGFTEPLPTSSFPSDEEQQMLQSTTNSGGKTASFRSFALTREYPFLASNLNGLYSHREILGYGPFLPKNYAGLVTLTTGGTAARGRELLMNNRVLSILNAGYVIVPSYGQAIEIPSNREIGHEHLLVLRNWERFGGSAEESGGYRFVASQATGSIAGIASEPLTLVPASAYILGFEIRADAKPDGVVGTDILGEEYDQDWLQPWMLPREWTNYRRLLLTGDQEKAKTIKIYTDSHEPIHVRNISLQRLNSKPSMEDYRVLRRGERAVVLQNIHAVPQAYFVSKVRRVSNYLEARSILWDNGDPFDITNEALVEGLPIRQSSPLSRGAVNFFRTLPNEIQITAHCDEMCFLVVADAFFPGWKAAVDGRATQIYPTNAVVRGIFVPKGDHEIRFLYEPTGVKNAAAISLVSLLALAGALVIFSKQNRRIL